MRNLNLLFNKTYYEALTASSFVDKTVMKENNTETNKKIYRTTFSHERDYMAPGEMVRQRFLMTVCYPGLLVGIGNAHNAGVSSEEIAVGFSFDYVTGQPYVPGSTVKGVLRSHFKTHGNVFTVHKTHTNRNIPAVRKRGCIHNFSFHHIGCGSR